MKKLWRVLTGRLMVVIPLLLLQLGFFVILFYGYTTYGTAMPVLDILALIIAIYIINRRNDPSYKIGWLLLVLAAPVIGVPLYLITGNRKVPKKLHHGTVRATRSLSDLIKPDESILDDIHDEDAKQIFRYGIRGGGFPVYEHTTSTYFKSGEEWYPVFKKELSNAKHFILLEYFIINQGWMLDDLVALLEEKVRQGVKVIMIYDDFGALDIPIHFDKQLQKRGIETYRFNKIRPSLAALMNNRDHRKITVVDNRVAFTGGVNISDEYINRHRRFGYWKDSAIMIEGDAVWSFTCMFLGMYTYVRGTNDSIDYEQYHLLYEYPENAKGFYQPYSDTPTDEEPFALNVHLNMIQHAKKYIYIDAPYLILTESMKTALKMAAKNGVDVRILTPHIPDKKFVFQITRGHYFDLISNGVKIYEYTPGFNHAKNMVADDKFGIVGTANTDYRSYFLHFENGVVMYDTDSVYKMKENFLEALEVSQEVTFEEVRDTVWIVKVFRAVLNVFIPLV